MNNGYLGWRIQNATADEADIDIFDVIGDPWEGITAKDFVTELRAITASKINLHINSPGGYVDDALAMYTAIQQHPADVTAYIESVAASAASFVAMAADKVVIAKNAKIMIHDAHGLAIGNAGDLRALADYLDEESQNIATIYADKTGGEADAWREAMQANDGLGTTYRGQAAVDAKLADELMATVSRRNLTPMRAAAYIKSRDAGRTMSQGNLDRMHEALTALDTVHEAVCDMGDGCPMEDTEDRLEDTHPIPAFDLGAAIREAVADLKT